MCLLKQTLALCANEISLLLLPMILHIGQVLTFKKSSVSTGPGISIVDTVKTSLIKLEINLMSY